MTEVDSFDTDILNVEINEDRYSIKYDSNYTLSDVIWRCDEWIYQDIERLCRRDGLFEIKATVGDTQVASSWSDMYSTTIIDLGIEEEGTVHIIFRKLHIRDIIYSNCMNYSSNFIEKNLYDFYHEIGRLDYDGNTPLLYTLKHKQRCVPAIVGAYEMFYYALRTYKISNRQHEHKYVEIHNALYASFIKTNHEGENALNILKNNNTGRNCFWSELLLFIYDGLFTDLTDDSDYIQRLKFRFDSIAKENRRYFCGQNKNKKKRVFVTPYHLMSD